MTELVRLQPDGLVGPDETFHVDAWGQAHINLITHAHADHARVGSREYWCAADCESLLRHRLGQSARIRALAYGRKERIGDCWISFHPAGHIRGSAQVRIERGSAVWVVTGDCKRDPDSTCEPFEPVACETLITEATFGLPIYRWSQDADRQIFEWWQWCRKEGATALLFCYALGKAQRILSLLRRFTDEEVLLHGAVVPVTELYRREGVSMVPTLPVADCRTDLKGRLVLAPPSAHRSPWMKRFRSVSTGFASGWMAVRGIRRGRGYERGFVLSDHADWPGLLRTIDETGASRVLVTHGAAEVLARFLREVRGIQAEPLRTEFGGGED